MQAAESSTRAPVEPARGVADGAERPADGAGAPPAADAARPSAAPEPRPAVGFRPRTARPAPRAPEEASIAQLAAAVVERQWTVLAITAAVVAMASAWLFVSPPVYETSVLVQVTGRTRPAAAFGDLGTAPEVPTRTEGELQVLRSRTLIGAVVDRLGLDVDVRPRSAPVIGAAIARRHGAPELAPAPFGLERFAWGGERVRVQKLAVSDALVGEDLVLTALDGGRYRLATEDGALKLEGEVGTALTGGAGDESVELLVSELVARPGTEIVVKKLHHGDVVERLKAALKIAEQGRDSGVAGVSLHGGDPARIAAVLDTLTAEYVRQNVERTSAESEKSLAALEAQLPSLKQHVERAEAALNGFRQKNGTLNFPVEAQAMFVRLGEIDRSLAELDLRTAELTGQYTEKHPELLTVAHRAEQLRAQRGQLEARMRALPNLDLESTRLARQLNVATELYLTVLGRAEELRIVRSGTTGGVRVLEQAAVPLRPVAPKPAFVLTLATLLGLGLGVGFVLVRRAVDRTARSAQEIEAATGLSVLAAIPRSASQRKLARRGRRGPLAALSVAKPGDPAVEDLRSLRTSVQFALHGSRSGLIAVGGLTDGAGKSFVSVNLAHLLAAAGSRVLVVDADLRRGILHRYFGGEIAPGLADVLAGSAPLDAAIRHADVPNLDVLTAGRSPRNPSELLAGPAFQRLLGEVARRYDAVVVDTPPILAVTDAALVGRQAAVNLLVLRAGEHDLGEIDFALRRLEQSGVVVTGLVLNQVRSPISYEHR